MTNAQRQLLKAGLLAETDPAVQAAIAAQDYTTVKDWCNGLSSTKAWAVSVDARTLFEASDLAKFNNIAQAANRDAWRLMLDFAPYDFSKASNRKCLPDIWGNTDSVPILQGCQEYARRGEVYVGGSTVTTNTVSGLKRDFVGLVTDGDAMIWTY